MERKVYILLFIFFGLAILSPGQSTQDRSGKSLSLAVDNLNFFRNNEFFSDLAEGYTLLGFHLTPTLKYSVNDRLIIRGGLHALKYSGRDDFRKISPYFSLQYRLAPKLSMTLGSYSITNNHRLAAPLFSEERRIYAYVENGLNFKYHHPDFFADLWLDWDQFIYRNDPFREKFTAGGSFDWRVTSGKSKVNLSIPLQLLVRHKGGQINTSGLPTTSVFNYASGVKLDFSISNSFLRTAGIKFLYLAYKELSDKEVNLYKNGSAFYPVAEAKSEHFSLRVGYWHAQKFYAPSGHPMFQNISVDDVNRGERKRHMMTTGFRYRRQVVQGMVLSVLWDNYMNTGNGNWDYTYSLSVSFKEDFFLKKVR